MNQKRCKETQLQRHEKAEGTVYLILSRASTLYKIGLTKNLRTRFKNLRTGDPSLELVAGLQGCRLLEDWLHAQFRKERQMGEWFALTDHQVQWVLSGAAVARFNEHGYSFRYSTPIPKDDGINMERPKGHSQQTA